MKKPLINFSFTLMLAMSATVQADSVGPYYATPSWDQTLPATTRFVVLSNFNSDAFLDRNTGLVWTAKPLQQLFPPNVLSGTCETFSVGNQFGWRLPFFHELTTLFSGNYNLDVPSSILTPLPAGALIVSATPDQNNPGYNRSIQHYNWGIGNGLVNLSGNQVNVMLMCVRAQ